MRHERCAVDHEMTEGHRVRASPKSDRDTITNLLTRVMWRIADVSLRGRSGAIENQVRS